MLAEPMTREHESWMRLAIEEAERARGATGDNPWVGCAIVNRHGELIGRGHTLGPGEDHAEIAAARDAQARGESVVGATLYSTLEPCSFHGRTPACSRSIAERGIARVVIGMRDPHPRVNGAGIQILRQAGVEVIEGVCEADVRRQLGSWVLEHHPHEPRQRAQTWPAPARVSALADLYAVAPGRIEALLAATEGGTRAGRLHHELIRGLVETCAIPSRDQLRALLGGVSAQELDRSFEDLAELHGVVLHPASHAVWAIHPFSLAPTPFLVESGTRRWWGNCAWCSLGIAVLVGEPCRITTTLGAEGEQVRLTVENGRVQPSDLVVHFPIPMSRAWDNVVYTCSTMLLFKDESQVVEWSSRHQIPRGDVQPIAKVLELAQRWYGEHLRPDWTKKSVAEARAIFADLGLSHPVWSLPSNDGRF